MAANSNPPALTGSLSSLSLVGLLQLLAAERRTGRLDVIGNGIEGSLWLADGTLVHSQSRAPSGPAEGEAALDRLALLDEGRFAFHSGPESPDRTLEGSTEHLLMEAAYRRDHHVRAETEGVELTAVPSFAPVPDGGNPPRFTTMQWRVLASIDGHKDVAALAADVGMPPQAMARIVGDLLALGVVRLR